MIPDIIKFIITFIPNYVLIHIMEKTSKNFEIGLLKLGAIG